MRIRKPATLAGRFLALCATIIAAAAVVVVPATPARADSIRDEQWWLESLNVSEVHKVTRGEGVVVAVVDTGVDPDHPDLKGNVLPGADLYDGNSRGHTDVLGHGTAMAALIAGHGHGEGNRSGILGIAPKAKILPVKVMRDDIGVNPPWKVAIGINMAVDYGADVISVSISGGSDPDLERAVKRAYRNNIPVIAAMGNTTKSSLFAGYPALYDWAVGVTIVGRNDEAGPQNVEDGKTGLAAPGADIVSARPGGTYSAGSVGSSNSTAIAAGAAALVRAAHPRMGTYDLFGQLMWTARDIGEEGHDDVFGWGTLDLERAVTGKPDDRRPKASASPSPASAAPGTWDECRGCPSTTTRVLQTIALFGGFFLVVGLIVFLVVRRKSRKLRKHDQRQAAPTAVPVDAFVAPGPAAPVQPPVRAQDDTAWRRPPGAGM